MKLTPDGMISSLTPYDILKYFEDENITAFIGGGWVRDEILGRKSKDIDVFVLNTDKDFKHLFTNDCKVITNYENMVMRDDVFKLYQYPSLNVDILSMNNPTIEDVLENFDVSICQAVCILEDDKLVYKVSKDFMDYINKGIIYRYVNIPTSDNHLDRVKKKFNITDFTKKESSNVELINYSVG